MKIGKTAPQPDLGLQAAKRVEQDHAVAALVAAAPTTPEAWESLGPRVKSQAERARDARAEALSSALLERMTAIRKGREKVAGMREKGEPITEVIRARFVELHQQRLELAWKLDGCCFTYPDEATRLERMAVLCDEEVSVALGDQWHGTEVQEWMRTVSAAVEMTDAESVRKACLWAVELACQQRYGGAT